MVDFYGFHVGKYTMTMDPMGDTPQVTLPETNSETNSKRP